MQFMAAPIGLRSGVVAVSALLAVSLQVVPGAALEPHLPGVRTAAGNPVILVADQPAGRRLDCAGGGAMTAQSSGDGFLRLEFEPAPAGSAGAAPADGECAWVDRGLNSSEPLTLVVSSDDPDAAALEQLAKNGGRFSVTAYNNNLGAMIVTRVVLNGDEGNDTGDEDQNAEDSPKTEQEAVRLTCQASPTMKVINGAGGSLRIEFNHARKSSSAEEPFFGKCALADRNLTEQDPVILIVPPMTNSKALKQEIKDNHQFIALAKDTGEGAFKATRIELPELEDQAADTGDDVQPDQSDGDGGDSPTPGQVVCFAGHTFHTGGPRKGKTFNTELCIDWSGEPCGFTDRNIVRQSVTQCTPGRTITSKVFYKSGKSVIWDMALDQDTGKLIGNWSQSDGARGEWVTH